MLLVEKSFKSSRKKFIKTTTYCYELSHASDEVRFIPILTLTPNHFMKDVKFDTKERDMTKFDTIPI